MRIVECKITTRWNFKEKEVRRKSQFQNSKSKVQVEKFFKEVWR
jgi:hypothetical protein